MRTNDVQVGIDVFGPEHLSVNATPSSGARVSVIKAN